VNLTTTQTQGIADRMVEVALDRIEDLARGRLSRESYNLIYDGLTEQIVPLLEAIEVPEHYNHDGELYTPDPVAEVTTTQRYGSGLVA
jgi:hypothetical protein